MGGIDSFIHSHYDANPNVHNVLQLIYDVVLKVVSVAYPMYPHAHCQMQSMMEFYNALGGPDDSDDLQNINIPEMKGIWDVIAPDIPMDPMNHPLKIRKLNIGTEENPKLVNIGDY